MAEALTDRSGAGRSSVSRKLGSRNASPSPFVSPPHLFSTSQPRLSRLPTSGYAARRKDCTALTMGCQRKDVSICLRFHSLQRHSRVGCHPLLMDPFIVWPLLIQRSG